MNITFVSADPGIPVFGCKGASIHLQEMMRAFIRQGAQVSILSPRLEDPAPEGLKDVRTITLPRLPRGSAEQRAHAILAQNKHIAAALEATQPDLIYERYALFAFAGVAQAQQLNVPSVLEVNSPLIEEQSAHRELALPQEAHAATAHAMQAATHVLAVSQPVADYAAFYGAKAPRVIPNAVSAERFPLLPSWQGPFRAGFLGTLKPWHDVGVLIEATAILRRHHHSAEVLIIGDGPSRPDIEAQAKALDVPVVFTGAVAASDVAYWLSQISVGIACYPGNQPFYFSPLKVYEYMAAQCPVIATDIGDLGSVISSAGVGMTIPPDQPETLANALAIYASDAERCRQEGSKARDYVLKHRTWDSIAASIIAMTEHSA